MANLTNRITVNTSSTLLQAANSRLYYFGIQNLASNADSIFLHIGEDDATTTNGLEVAPDRYLEISNLISNEPIKAIVEGGVAQPVIITVFISARQSF